MRPFRTRTIAASGFASLAPLVLLTTLGVTSGVAQAEASMTVDRFEHIAAEIEAYATGFPFVAPDIALPRIPERRCDITDYGAVPDGLTPSTGAIHAAIADCAAAGGGTVIVPPGSWLTGPIFLASHIELHLENGALLIFSKDLSDYFPAAGTTGTGTPTSQSPAAPLRAEGVHDIAITGDGIVLGNGDIWRRRARADLSREDWDELQGRPGSLTEGDVWWPSAQAKASAGERPDLVRVANVERVLIDGPTFMSPPDAALGIEDSRSVVVRNVKTRMLEWQPDGNGIELAQSRDVIVYNSTLYRGNAGVFLTSAGRVGDDEPLLGDSGPDAEGPLTKGILLADNKVFRARAGLVIGGPTDGGIADVSVSGLTLFEVENGLRFSGQVGSGGLVHGIAVDRVLMFKVRDTAIEIGAAGREPGVPGPDASEPGVPAAASVVADRTVGGAKLPEFRDIHIRRVVAVEADRSVAIHGLPGAPVRNVTVTESSIQAAKGVSTSHTLDVHINLEGYRPPVRIDPVEDLAAIAGEVERYVAAAPFAMQPPALPRIPDRDCVITDYGAAGDGVTLNTKAIADAITDCAAAGGGRVVVPEGLWLTGPITLQSNINLHVQRNAMLLFHPDFSLYPLDGSDFRPLIYGKNVHDVMISGEGVINGDGFAWRPVKSAKPTQSEWSRLLSMGGRLDGSTWYPSQEAYRNEQQGLRRPELVYFANATSVLIQNVTLQDSPLYALHLHQTDGAVIRGVTVDNDITAQNGDGIDPRSSRNVVIYRNTVTAGDDAMAMGAAGSFSSQPSTQNLVLGDNTIYSGHGGFAIGSVVRSGMRNVSVRNHTFIGTERGLRFKSDVDRGNIVENVYIDGVRMADIRRAAITFNMSYEGDPGLTDSFVPEFRNFHIRNVTVNGAETAIGIHGRAGLSTVHDIALSHITIQSDRGAEIENVTNLTLDQVRILPSAGGPTITIRDSSGVTLKDVPAPPGAAPFLVTQGETRDVRVTNELDLSIAGPSPESAKAGLSGRVPLELAGIDPGFEWSQVDVWLGGRRLYSGAEPPRSLILDTLDFPDGEHVLLVALTPKRGMPVTLWQDVLIDNIRLRLSRGEDAAGYGGIGSAVVRGVVPVAYAVDLPEGLALESARLVLNGRTLYESRDASGQVLLDTFRLPDGPHTLSLVARTADQRTDALHVEFLTRNLAVEFGGPFDSPVFGMLPVRIDVAKAPELNVDHVLVTVDGTVVFEGEGLPVEDGLPGDLTIDTLRFPDGEHRLRVEVSAGTFRAQASAVLLIENHWHLTDPLDAPVVSPWIGTMNRSLTSGESRGWRYASDRPERFWGDRSRRVALGAGEFLAWEAPNLQEITVTVYVEDPAFEPPLEFAVSVDGQQWHALAHEAVQREESAAGWHRLVLRGVNARPSSLVRLSTAPDAERVEKFQIGEVQLVGLKVTQ